MERKPFADLFNEHVRDRIKPALIVNQVGSKATIRLYTEIGWFGITADQFAETLDAITADEIEVQINSMGGDVFDGIAIYNSLRSHPRRSPHVLTGWQPPSRPSSPKPETNVSCSPAPR